jgi:DeoR family transcriptional regulator of aga operon
MKHAEKSRIILELLEKRGKLSAAEAAEKLHLSAPTIRREFKRLADSGAVCRVHGRIEALTMEQETSLPLALRRQWFTAVKERLARRVAEELPHEGAIFVDGGSTTAPLAMFLDSPKLRIITNSLALNALFMEKFPLSGGPELLLTGGIVDRKSAILLGPEAERTIAGFCAECAVISGTALDGEYLYDNQDAAAALQRRMIANAKRTIVVTDSSKLGKTAMCRSEQVEKISLVVTDFNPDAHETVAELKRRGVKVILV